MKRYLYDLSNYSAKAGRIGRLMTLNCIPVVGNDSHKIDYVGSFRLSPLRRALVLDCRIDIVTLFVPNRHMFSDETAANTWEAFLRDGVQDDTKEQVLANVPTAASGDIGYIPVGYGTNRRYSLPVVKGYNRIWNEFFRVPAIEGGEITAEADVVPDVGDNRLYGLAVGRLPTLLTTNHSSDNDLTIADVGVDVTAEDFSLIDMVKAKQQFNSETDRQWFAERYRDLMTKTFGSGMIHTDADERPELCMHTTHWMSGYDVDGTSDANLGQYSGKSQTMVQHSMPLKHFKEHGMLWTLAVLRFPPIFNDEVHPLISRSQSLGNFTFNYDLSAGDPEVLSARRPIEVKDVDFLGLADTAPGRVIGYMPYGNWFRAQPNTVHPKFRTIPGFPFDQLNPTTPADIKDYMAYEQPDSLDMFASSELADWNCTGKFNVTSMRIIPPASNSVYAGAE